MKLVATYDNSFSANLAKSVLENEGIESYVLNDHVGMVAGMFNNDLLSIQLTVADEDYDAAVRILKAAEKPEE